MFFVFNFKLGDFGDIVVINSFGGSRFEGRLDDEVVMGEV